MGRWGDILIQAIGFLGLVIYCISFQVKANRRFFVLQMLGCVAFSVQFALLGAFGGCFSLLINLIRNTMLTKYNESKWIRWKGWVVIFSALTVVGAAVTWAGWISILPAAATIAGTIAYWTNNAKNIRLANLTVSSPCMLLYDVLVRSWGGVLTEGAVILSVVISVVRFGWKALDGDTIET